MYGTTTPSNIATNSLPNKACIHSYKPRLFRNKAALMILQWIFTASLNLVITFQIIDQYNAIYIGGPVALSAPIALVAEKQQSERIDKVQDNGSTKYDRGI